MHSLDPEWWEWLRDVSADLLADRERGYPALIAAGKMTQAEAERRIRIMASIAADWQRVTDLYAGRQAKPRDETAYWSEKREELAQAITRLTTIYDRAFDALPRVLPPAMGSLVEGIDRLGSTIEDLVRQANDRLIAAAPVRPVAEAWNRLKAAELMHRYADRDARAMFMAELNADLRERDAMRVEAA